MQIRARNVQLGTNVSTVHFANGTGIVTLTLIILPNTVARFSKMDLEWEYFINGNWRHFGDSTHTFFFTLSRPLCMLGDYSDLAQYFELFDWSCRWADQVKTLIGVVEKIWEQFSPVKTQHNTKLIYWSGHGPPHWIQPAQRLTDAIRSYGNAGLAKGAVSCIVFDRIFCDALALHGVQSEEMQVSHSPPFPHQTEFNDACKSPYFLQLVNHANYTATLAGCPPLQWPEDFGRIVRFGSVDLRRAIPECFKFQNLTGETFFKPFEWHISNPAGQGNPQGPTKWTLHWIARVYKRGEWWLFDPSYGVSYKWSWTSPNEPTPKEYLNDHLYFLVRDMDGAAKKLIGGHPRHPRLDAKTFFSNQVP